MSNSVFQGVMLQLKETTDRVFGVIDTEGNAVIPFVYKSTDNMMISMLKLNKIIVRIKMNKKSLTLLFLTVLFLLFSFAACDLFEQTVAVSAVEFLQTEHTFSFMGTNSRTCTDLFLCYRRR